MLRETGSALQRVARAETSRLGLGVARHASTHLKRLAACQVKDDDAGNGAAVVDAQHLAKLLLSWTAARWQAGP